MKTHHVTRDHLRAMRHGETVNFELPSVPAVYSGRAQCYQFGRFEGCRFETVADLARCVLSVTRYDR